MANNERQCLYYGEDDLYLYHYVKEKRKPNAWVKDLIRNEYMREKGLVSVETTPTPTQTQIPSVDAQIVELLTQQVQALAKQVADQQELLLNNRQATITQAIEPRVKQEPVEPVKEVFTPSQAATIEPLIETFIEPVTESIVKPVETKSEAGQGRLGNLKAKAMKTKTTKL